jgi:RimJ/RimL family protein N-acetyltransferase
MDEKVKLRALTRADIPMTCKWHNDPKIKNLYAGHPFPVNEENENQWYDKILTCNIPTTVFGIVHIESSVLIGISVLNNINLIHREAEYAIFIGDSKYRGKGFHIEALNLTLRFAFGQLGLNRIFIRILENNKGTIRLCEHHGFKREGLLRQSKFKNNCFHNEVLMSMLRDEFKYE